MPGVPLLLEPEVTVGSMGEHARRDALFRRVEAEHGAGLWRLTAGYAHTRADREDLYHDILVAILGALPTFREESSLRTFVYRIGHNRGISHRRGLRPHESLPPEGPVSGEPSPEAEAIAGTERARLTRAIRALPHGRRQVLMLHLEGMEHNEIGEVLDITPNNVGVRLHRARNQLREYLAHSHHTRGSHG